MEQQAASLRIERDLRVDFFRGVALYMILVDHVVGDPLSNVTYRRFGFSDAAELFVFLSGVSCAIVYSRVLAKRGWAGFLTAIARRTVKIYAFYLATSIIVILFISAASSLATGRFTDNPFTSLDANLGNSIWSTIFLTSPPALPGILVLYLMLTAIVVPLFLLGRNSALPLVLSFLIWSVAQFYPDLSPHLAAHSYFNWLAWQFLFSIGMFVGLRYGSGAPTFRPMGSGVLTVAWFVVIVSLAYHPLMLLGPKLGVDTDHLRHSAQTMKENLSAMRLVHFLAVAALVANYLKSDSIIFRNVASFAVINTGRHSLEVFCLSAILSVILNIALVVEKPSAFTEVLLDLVAISVILGMVSILTERRAQARSNRIGETVGEQHPVTPGRSARLPSDA
jgi:hypothetical protein